jgi:beta-glucosidase
MKRIILIIQSLLLVFSTAGFSQTTKGSGTAKYDEKLQQVKHLIGQMTIDEKIDQLTNVTPGIKRLGIKPYNWWSEALHGVARNGRATVFPQPIGLGATFDADIIKQIGDAIADEARAKFNAAQSIQNYAQYAGLTFWSPNINIFRDARWGRGMETYGEDPYLTGTLGTAFVLGLQGSDPFYLKASACAKHYAVHSGPESTRHSANVNPSPRDLRETYLPAFKALVQQGHVESVMGAYNRVYGESASGSKLLLKDILRSEWGFNGHVVSDCGAVTDIFSGHRIAKSEAEAAAIAIKNGLNVECGGSMSHIKEAIAQGLVTEKDIDNALIPLFMTRMKLGILVPDADCPYNDISPDVVTSDAKAAIALKAAEESMVLLKNNGNVLPLNKDIKTMYILGPAATDVFSMMGNYYGLSNRYTSYIEGIMDKVDEGTTVNYRQGFLVSSPSNSIGSWGLMEFQGTDVSILFLGNNGNTEGEEGDAISSPATGDRKSLALPASQLEVVRNIKKNRNPNARIITVITGGSPVDLRDISEISDAVIYAWYPGQEGGKALGRLLFGEASFSGRLPMTFPTTLDNLPALDDYSMNGRTYKYQTADIEYPFGYGLTYGDIKYSSLSVTPESGKRINGKQNLLVKCDVANVGTHAATETVQLYLSTPTAGAGSPIASLIGFKRVDLRAGQTVSVEFTVTPEQLQTVQADGTSKILKGNYCITVGGAAPNYRSDELGVSKAVASFRLK